MKLVAIFPTLSELLFRLGDRAKSPLREVIKEEIKEEIQEKVKDDINDLLTISLLAKHLSAAFDSLEIKDGMSDEEKGYVTAAKILANLLCKEAEGHSTPLRAAMSDFRFKIADELF